MRFKALYAIPNKPPSESVLNAFCHTSFAISVTAGSATAANCSQCPDGKWSSNTPAAQYGDALACTKCKIGKHGLGLGKTSEADGCEACPAGHFADVTGTAVCKSCGSGKFAMNV
jgi:hypothetical protein